MLLPLHLLLEESAPTPPPAGPTADTYITHGPTREEVESVCAVLERYLGVEVADLWTGQELEDYVVDGYNALAFATACLWATEVAPDVAFAFNYTSAFELNYFVGGDVLSGLAQFTTELERDYLDNAQGPANINYHWEFNLGYAEDADLPTEISALVDLPDDFYEMERSTWNTIRMDALRSRHFEEDDSRYELNKGEVVAYTQDKDGLRRLRKWRVPSAPYVPYDMDDDSTEFGYLVQIEDVDSDTPQGAQVGDFVCVQAQHAFGDPWGIIVGIYKDTNNVRYEYHRRGTRDGCDNLELPLRYQVYVRHYALARALEREGDGQDLELAAHYQGRYEAGIARMLKRQSAMSYQRKYVFGGGPKKEGRLPLARLPHAYGRVVKG